MSVTVRGRTKVEWRPAFTMALSSPDGLVLDSDGLAHDLIVTLTNTADGSPVPYRTITLTTSPTGRGGHGTQRPTDANGQATFQVSNTLYEAVVYTASLVPSPPTSEVTITGTLTLYWKTPGIEGIFLFTAVMSSPNPGPSAGSPTTVVATAASSANIDNGALGPIDFPSGATATFHTTPGGGPGDGEVKTFAEIGLAQGEATLTVTSAVPGAWDYSATLTPPGPFSSGESNPPPQTITWS